MKAKWRPCNKELLSEPVIQLGLAAVYVSWPTPVIPYVLVWAYDMLLWTSEPIWQIVEVIGIVQLITTFSSDVKDRIDDQPNLAKGVLLTVAVVTYGIAGYLIKTVLQSENGICQIIVICVLCVWVAIHMYAFWIEKGIISETGAFTLFTVVLVYGMLVEKTSVENVVQVPLEWQKAANESAYIKLAFKMLTSGLDGISHALSFCSHLFTPWFILSGIFRVLAVLFTTEWLLTWYHNDAEANDTSTTDNNFQDMDTLGEEDTADFKTLYTKYSSPLIVRLVVYLVYGQFLVHHIHRVVPTEDSYLVTQILQGFVATFFRTFQIVGVFILYGYKLYTRSDDEDF